MDLGIRTSGLWGQVGHWTKPFRTTRGQTTSQNAGSGLEVLVTPLLPSQGRQLQPPREPKPPSTLGRRLRPQHAKHRRRGQDLYPGILHKYGGLVSRAFASTTQSTPDWPPRTLDQLRRETFPHAANRKQAQGRGFLKACRLGKQSRLDASVRQQPHCRHPRARPRKAFRGRRGPREDIWIFFIQVPHCGD